MTAAACAGAATTSFLAAHTASLLAAAPAALLAAATAWPALAACCWHPLPLPVCDWVWAMQFLRLELCRGASDYVKPPSVSLELIWMEGCLDCQAGSSVEI